MILIIIYCVFILATLIQLGFYLGVFLKLARYQTVANKQTYSTKFSTIPVSIIICARNEATNLKSNLPYILDQDFPEFEVIVVNDDSSDGTEMVLHKAAAKSSNLRIVKISDKGSKQIGKKFALAKGIEAARYELLLLTDADCRPNSRQWLSLMQNEITDKIDIALAYGPYFKHDGLLNKFIRFETVYTAIQYFSFALIGLPYMGVGRNLIYKKKLYTQFGGFKKHEHIASGDDDLFINAIARENNVSIVIHPKAFVYSEPKKNWKDYYRQKLRHLTTGVHYKIKHQALLGMLSLSHFLHYTMGAVLLLKTSTIFVLFIYVVRISIVLYVYAAIFNKLRESSLLKWIPFLDAAYILYYILFTPTLLFGKTERWK